MFHLSFGFDDVKRAVWTFIQAFLAYLVVQASGLINIAEWKGLLFAAVAAGWSAAKNALLADDAVVK